MIDDFLVRHIDFTWIAGTTMAALVLLALVELLHRIASRR